MAYDAAYAGEYEIRGRGRTRVARCLTCGIVMGRTMTGGTTAQERAINERRYYGLVKLMEAHCDSHHTSRFTPNTSTTRKVHGDDPPF